ncbi:hypothetical protein E9232_007162 [Inquilinus ginsengisoli]|uniref:DUF29 domain-containing protein n=2 Tax=Inquilinus ginsengisoli TaxID=363840 RepID=A0ABU1K153_9PROT|nr:hypothetical protein [Inquilinus ginsengisoli]
MFMDKAPSAPEPAPPSDPDLHWTGWALQMLREAAEIDLRAKRMTAQQQSVTLAGPQAPDFALMQSRLSRSLRLSIAMTERIRTEYLMRKGEREGSGEQERRRRRREQAAEAATRLAAAPGEGWSVEHTRSAVWEKLVEDEILDVQLDTLSPEEFVREVCRRIGRPPAPPWPPQGREEDAGDEAGLAGADSVAADSGEGWGEGWAEPPEESGPSRLPSPDSS